MAASRSASGSGTFPAASLSKILSASPSIELRAGAGGRGLFTSDGVDGRCFDGDVPGEESSGLVRLGENDRSMPSGGCPASLFLLFKSTLISLPWRELGGRGFFLNVDGDCWDLASGPLTKPSWSSSPSSDTSCEILGDSGGRAVSNMDCLEIEDASVMLAPSPVDAGGFAAGALAAAPGAPPRPARRSSLKACTSREPFPPAATFSAWFPNLGVCPASSNVF